MLDLPHQIWEAEAADPANQIFITRMFHNKIGFFLSNYLRCYLSYFSLENFIFYLPGLYFAVRNKSHKMLVFALLIPLFPLLEIGPLTFRQIIFYGGYIIISGYGLFNIFSRFYSKNFPAR